MRCYRCGALMNDHNAVCPECGFNINSPVEIETNKWMKGVQIFDAEGALLWESTDGGTALIEAPTRRRITIRWFDREETRNVLNGEAYRFEQTKLAKGIVRLIKTRTIPKRKKCENPIEKGFTRGTPLRTTEIGQREKDEESK